jgi:hypothetical protein
MISNVQEKGRKEKGKTKKRERQRKDPGKNKE